MHRQTISKKKLNLPLMIGFVVIFFILRYILFDFNEDNIKQENLPFSYSKIHYTKHAKERMDCRKISEQEVEEVLLKGDINNQKTVYSNEACSTKYAIEYRVATDKQFIRVVAAPCNEKLNIVTVIDLESNNECE
jgi:hypothetical protein